VMKMGEWIKRLIEKKKREEEDNGSES